MMLLAYSLAALPNAFAADAVPSEAVAVHFLAADPLAQDSAPAVADDEDGDDPAASDDSDADESSVKAEKDAVRSGKSDAETSSKASDRKSKKRTIKIIQKKNFMKIGRYEAGPQIGFVTNDPFLNRYILGVTFDYHITEIFAAEIQAHYSPILGTGGENDPDWKALTKQILSENSVSPDISKLDAMGSVALAFSPIYGKAAVGRKVIAFDIFGTFGIGAIHTADDEKALQISDKDRPDYESTAQEWHPTTVISGGARVAFSESVAARLEGKATSYIETINGGTLEMKNNFILQGGVTFFFPSMK